MTRRTLGLSSAHLIAALALASASPKASRAVEIRERDPMPDVRYTGLDERRSKSDRKRSPKYPKPRR